MRLGMNQNYPRGVCATDDLVDAPEVATSTTVEANSIPRLWVVLIVAVVGQRLQPLVRVWSDNEFFSIGE
jgi:hypothetical protein